MISCGLRALRPMARQLSTRGIKLGHLRLLAALAVAVLGTVGVWGARRGAVTKLLPRWPYGIGVAIGAVWWGLLDPSAVGCLVAAICVTLGAWSHWRRRASGAATMVRLPR